MKKLILLGLLALTACGQRRETAEEAALIRQRDGEQSTALFKEMTRFADQDTTVICVSGRQYMAWIDYGSTVQVHHIVLLDGASTCTGGAFRDLNHVPPKPRETTPASVK